LKQAFRKLVVSLFLATAPFALAADRARVMEVAGDFICLCGCHQVLHTCSMIACPNRNPMLAEVEQQLDQGLSEESIIHNFTEKYGMGVLSAPPVSGFNLTAWITPFVSKPAAGVDITKYNDRVEEELRKYTPED
jgi:cytochrome c-type biogenesis protein CcmH